MNESEEDRGDLRRAARVNALGFVARIAQPVLFFAVARQYGAARLGIYGAGVSAVWIAMRFCHLGLDRSLVWWIPRCLEQGGEVHGVWGALARVAVRASVLSLAGALSAEALLGALSTDVPGAATSLSLFAISLTPLSLVEMLLQASIARRRMGIFVVVREVVTPTAALAGALLLHVLGHEDTGLGWAFLASQLVALVIAALALRRSYRGVPIRCDFALPKELARYAAPLAVSEIAQTTIHRVDKLVLAAFAPAATVGVYEVVKQFGNTLWSLRGAFDSMVTTLVAKMSAGGVREADATRLASAYSEATTLVTLTQLPVAAFFLAFDTQLLALAGEGFERGVWGVRLFCGFWLVHGLIGLSGHVVNGLGVSRATRFAMLSALGVELLLLFALAPTFGLEGTVVAVAVAFLAQACIQLLQMRRLTGRWNYTRRVAEAALCGLVGISVLALLRGSLPAGWLGGGVALAAAASIFGLGALWIRRAQATQR